jgi:hypothetical protein
MLLDSTSAVGSGREERPKKELNCSIGRSDLQQDVLRLQGAAVGRPPPIVASFYAAPIETWANADQTNAAAKRFTAGKLSNAYSLPDLAGFRRYWTCIMIRRYRSLSFRGTQTGPCRAIEAHTN